MLDTGPENYLNSNIFTYEEIYEELCGNLPQGIKKFTHFYIQLLSLAWKNKLIPENLKKCQKCSFRAQVAPLIIDLDHFWGYIRIPH